MLVVAKAIMVAKKNDAYVIRPTWERISISNYKRHYFNIFSDYLKGSLKKIILLLFCKKTIYTVSSFDYRKEPYYELVPYYDAIRDYFFSNIQASIIAKVNSLDFCGAIAVHIRLGDYKKMKGLQTSIDWYVNVINMVIEHINPKRIYVFSDGENEEIKDVLELQNVERCFTGTPIGDIIAMSKCNLIIGSSSSFSAWSAFLGQVAIVAEKMHFGRVLFDSSREFFFDKRSDSFISYLKSL